MSTTAPDETTDAGTRLAVRLVLAAAGCVVLVAVTYLLMVRTRLGQRFDDAALIGAFQQNSAVRLSDGFFIQSTSAAAFMLALALVLGVTNYRNRPRLGIALIASAVLAVVLTHALKVDVLTRPALTTSTYVIKVNSFPSGHTATAVSAAFILVVASPPAIRGIVTLLAGTYACVIAQEVQTAGWHRPSDAIGAAFVAFAIVAIVGAAFARWRPLGSGTQRTHLFAFATLAVAWIVSGLLSAIHAAHALATLRGASAAEVITPSLRNDAHAFSTSMTVLVVVTLLGLLLALLGRYDLDQPARRG